VRAFGYSQAPAPGKAVFARGVPLRTNSGERITARLLAGDSARQVLPVDA
jgi:hypothetical protein